MIRLPRKARSEFVLPMKSAGGFMLATRCMFHSAWAASNMPALSPTRGSGIGAIADRLQLLSPHMLPPPPLAGEAPVVDAFGWAQAATARRARANGRTRGGIAHPYKKGL